jgi:hypothetical protein
VKLTRTKGEPPQQDPVQPRPPNDAEAQRQHKPERLRGVAKKPGHVYIELTKLLAHPLMGAILRQQASRVELLGRLHLVVRREFGGILDVLIDDQCNKQFKDALKNSDCKRNAKNDTKNKKQQDSKKKNHDDSVKQDEVVIKEENDEADMDDPVFNIITTGNEVEENKQDDPNVSSENKEETDEFNDLEKHLLGMHVSLFDVVFDSDAEES